MPADRDAPAWYLDATALCRLLGVMWADYWRSKKAHEFLIAAAEETGLNHSELVKIIRGGRNERRATLVHPVIWLNVVEWCRPDLISILLYKTMCNLAREEGHEGPGLPPTYVDSFLTILNDKRRRDKVYFITDEQEVKIGYSFDPEARLVALQRLAKKPLRIAHVIESIDASLLEQELHNRFAVYRLHGEWFTFSDEIKDFIAMSELLGFNPDSTSQPKEEDEHASGS